jgi:hypothetical protein
MSVLDNVDNRGVSALGRKHLRIAGAVISRCALTADADERACDGANTRTVHLR